jgi:hypothetical protein
VGRLLLFLAIVTLLWALFRAFLRYMLRSTATAPARSDDDAAPPSPEKLSWYRRHGYREWVRYRVGYTLYTRSDSAGETLVEEKSSHGPWFEAESDEGERWLAEQRALPSDEGEPWSERWIAGRGVQGDERRWLPRGQRPG